MSYNPSIFMNSNPNIVDNKELREPQTDAYMHAFEHFILKKETSHAIIVLPTGVGKTGLMGLLPWIVKNAKNNAAMLALYFNAYLKNELGSSRETWSIDDYKIANNKLDELYEYVDTIMGDFIKTI